MADGLDISPTTPLLLQGDCLELMKTLPAKSVDLFLCDLPYGETNCSWDTLIDMAEFWKEFKRIRKSKRTACIHFCSTGFGYSLIKSWEKGFKMDMVWKKRNKTGGLQSRYRPMRNHEMIYFFYEQAPKYNRDKYHKRIKNVSETEAKGCGEPTIYGASKKDKGWWAHNSFKGNENPASVLEEEEKAEQRRIGTKGGASEKEHIYTKDAIKAWNKAHPPFVPPTPASVLEEQEREYWADQPNDSKTGHGWDKSHMKSPRVPSFDPILPESVQEDNSIDIFDEIEEPHLAPFSVYEGIKCFIGKRNHQTEKPQDILEFILKYWTDEGDVVLDPTMGSGSTGVACKKMGRNFIGIELTDKYFNVAQKRINPDSN